MGVWCYKFFNQEFLATLITNLSQPGKTRETSNESTLSNSMSKLHSDNRRGLAWDTKVRDEVEMIAKISIEHENWIL